MRVSAIFDGGANSFGAFLTFARVKRDNAEARILAAIGGATPSAVVVGGDASDVDVAPDIAALAREQVRQHVSQNFAGHELATPVGHTT